MNKNFLAIFLFVPAFFICTSSIAQFREIHTAGNINNDIKGMSFLNASTGFVAFSNYIGFTQDSGYTYVQRTITPGNTNFNGYAPVNLTLGFNPTSVHAVTTDSLFIYGHYSAEPSILFSADQGQTWKLVYHDNINSSSPDIYNRIFDLKFPGSTGNLGIAVQHDKILRSTNRGQSWTVVSFTNLMERLSFPSGTTGYAVGGDNLMKTTNSGSNWSSSNMPVPGTGFDYNNVFFLSNTVGYISEVISKKLYRTINGGSSWTKINDETLVPVDGSDLLFINDSTGFMCKEFSYQVYKTTDSGKIWEPCKKNTGYQYLGYGFSRMQFLNSQTGWAAGAGEYLMMTTNGTPVLPKAFFKIDTTNYTATNNVSLKNFSRPYYQYSWYKNDTLIGTGYNASYIHIGYPLQDTLKLIVSNGLESDTAIQYQQFPAPQPSPVISSFTPASGNGLASITINGSNFTGATAVSFGGVPAFYFQVLNNNVISAQVGLNGASGNVTVSKPAAVPGSLGGFTFLELPTITSFTPASTDTGTSVTITGTNFSASPLNNTVYFGAVKTNVLTASSSSLSVKVPAGASYAPLAVTVNSLTALSPKLFPVSFTGSILSAATFPVRSVLTAGTLPKYVAVADLDLDGKPDLIVANKTSNTILVYRNTGSNGNAAFAAAVSFAAGSLNKPSRVIAADADGDGRLDIVITETGGNYMSVLRNTSTVGNIGFATKVNFSTSSNFNYDNSESIAADDFDGDGKIDFAVANLHDQKISIEINKSIPGSLSFQRYDISTFDVPYSVGLKDIDGDGKPDIIVGNNGGNLSIYRNLSNRATNTIQLAPAINLSGPSLPKHLSIADLDGDGRHDIAVTDYSNGKIFVFRNNSAAGNILFDAHTDLLCGTNPAGTSVADVDGDGKPDIAVANTGSNTLSVFKNLSGAGNIVFAAKVDYSTGPGPEGILVADISNDGQPEIISANTTSNNISILKRSGSQDISNCTLGSSSGISSSIAGAVYQWQLDNGTGFSNISDNTNYSGTNTQNLQLNNIDNSWYGYKFRCVTDALPGIAMTIKFTNTWTGAISNAWENPANWSCGAVPQSNTDVYINSGTVIIAANTTIGSLTIAAGVTFTVSAGVNITTTH